jgi:hypothetical protein
MSRIPTHQCLPSGRGGFIVGGVAEALKLSSLAITAIKKTGKVINNYQIL